MRRILTLIISLCFALVTFGQERTVTGTVTGGDSNETLPGVSVIIEGTTVGTITDIDGNYQIKVPANMSLDEVNLVFSYVGYLKESIPVNNQSTIDVVMVADIKDLDEIVVVGYGVQKKSLVTGAISKVGSEQLEQNQVRIEQALQGKVAGVNIIQESGSPGAGLTMRIRGTGTNRNSNPLFIVDGMRTGGIEYLNPNDIESVEILKDAASAAIYGSEGANGVVLITTKSGKKGASEVSYNANFGIQEAKNRHEVLNAEQYATYYREGLRQEIKNNYRELEIPDELLNNLINASYPFSPDTLGVGTDWMDEIFTIAPMQEHNISITGGSEKTSVFFSGSYYNQDGVVGGDKSNFERITSRLNVDHEVKDWLKVSGRVSYTHFDRLEIDENNEFGGVISNAMNIDPLTPVYYEDTNGFPAKYINQIRANFDNYENSSLKAPGDKGYYGMSKYVQNEVRNPRAQMDNKHSTWAQDKLMASASATIEPIKGLKLKSVYDIDLAYGTNKYWNPKSYYHSINYNFTSNTGQYNERHFTWQWENILTYSKQFDLHNITLLAGTTAREYSFNYLSGFGEGLQEESWNFAVLDAVLSDSTPSAAGGGNRNWDNKLLSYFGRAQYNFAEKYMIDATLRSDASSKLSASNRTQYFPSVSLGWVVSQESFWNVAPINFMKLRFSWGQNGSARSLGSFEYVSTISSTAEASYYISGGTRLAGAEPTALSNSELVWETSQQTDIGLDIRFLENRLAFTTDVYFKKTIDLITTANFPEYVGNNKPSANAGDVLNKGIEMELDYKNSLGEVFYNVNFNAAYNKNEITSLDGIYQGANLGTLGALTYMEEGMPVWYFRGYETDGMFNSFDEIEAYVGDDGEMIQPAAYPGDVKFIDRNGDGAITEDDKTMIGSPHPDWTLGLNGSVNYKGFDFSFALQGVFGNEVYYGAYRGDLTNNNKPTFFYENAWTPEEMSQDFPRFTVNDNNNNFSFNDLFVFDGSFVRLQNIELGYSLQPSILNKINVKKVRVYVSGKNMFVISDYPGGDPEIGNSNGGDYKTSIGIDRGMYPRPRILSFGLNITI